jgi:hypothetical protein
LGSDAGKQTVADGPGATIGAYPDQSYPGKPTNLRWHRRPLLDPGDAKMRRSGSKSGSGRWSQWDEIGWVHYPEIGWSHSDEIRGVQSLEILHPAHDSNDSIDSRTRSNPVDQQTPKWRAPDVRRQSGARRRACASRAGSRWIGRRRTASAVLSGSTFVGVTSSTISSPPTVPTNHSTRSTAINSQHVHRWVIRYVPESEKRWHRFARPVNTSWRVDETYIKVRGQVELSLLGGRQARQNGGFSASSRSECRRGGRARSRGSSSDRQ